MPLDPEAVLDIIAREGLIARSKLTPEATLSSLGVTSLDLISVAFALEDSFGIVLDRAELEDVPTVGALMAVIVGKADAATPGSPAPGAQST